MLSFQLVDQIKIGIFLALGVYCLVRFFSLRKKQEGEAVNWTPLEAVILTLGIYLATQVIVVLFIGLGGSLLGYDSFRLSEVFDTPALQFLINAFVGGLTIAAVYWFMRRRQTPWRAIGWVRPRWRDAGYALIGFGMYFVLFTMIAYRLLTKFFPQVDTNQQQELGFSTTTAGPELIFVLVSLVILPPLIEEILVRGFLYTGLRNQLHVVWAAIITSVVFGAAHLQWGSDAPLLWVAAADTFVLSLVLVTLREKSGSLWPGIGLHFIKNALAFLALFVFKVT